MNRMNYILLRSTERIVAQHTMRNNSCRDRYKIMKQCWLEDPNARPFFSELTMKLKKMENQHKVRFKQEPPWTILILPQLSSFKFVYLH